MVAAISSISAIQRQPLAAADRAAPSERASSPCWDSPHSASSTSSTPSARASARAASSSAADPLVHDAYAILTAAPPTWQRQQDARAILTREFFEREYIAAGKNLRQLEADTGIPRRFLTQVAREHGITMTGVRGPAPAGPCPLPGHDLTGQTSRTGSPAEPGDQIPGDIRRAAGNNPAGWPRLRRFQIAMTDRKS